MQTNEDPQEVQKIKARFRIAKKALGKLKECMLSVASKFDTDVKSIPHKLISHMVNILGPFHSKFTGIVGDTTTNVLQLDGDGDITKANNDDIEKAFDKLGDIYKAKGEPFIDHKINTTVSGYLAKHQDMSQAEREKFKQTVRGTASSVSKSFITDSMDGYINWMSSLEQDPSRITNSKKTTVASVKNTNSGANIKLAA